MLAGSDIGQHAHLDDTLLEEGGKTPVRLVVPPTRWLQFVTELVVEALNGEQRVQTNGERGEREEGGKTERKRRSNARGPAAKADNDYRVGAPRHDAARRPEVEKKSRGRERERGGGRYERA